MEPTNRIRGTRALLAGLTLAGVVSVLGAGAVLAQDPTATPSASPSTEANGDAAGRDHNCPDRQSDSGETDGTSS